METNSLLYLISAIGIAIIGLLVLLAHRLKSVQKDPRALTSTDTTNTPATGRSNPSLPQATGPNELFSIEPIQLNDLLGSSEIRLSKNFRTSISALMQHSPGLAVSVGTAGSAVYRMTFSPEVTASLSNGTLTLMRSGQDGVRAFAVDAAGKIHGQGTLSTADGLRAVSTVAAVWQVLAIVTAQKFLADINARLAAIETSVTDLKEWLETEQQGRIRGRIEYLKDLAHVLNDQKYTELDTATFAHQLEQLAREAEEGMETNRTRALEQAEVLKVRKLDGNAEENADAIKKAVETYYKSSSYFLAFAYIQALASGLRAALPVNRAIGSHRLLQLERKISDLRLHNEEVAKVAQAKISDLKGGWFDSDSEVKSARKSAHQRLTEIKANCERIGTAILEYSEESRSRLELHDKESERPLSLLVRTSETGEVIEVRAEPGKEKAKNRKSGT